MNATKPPPKPLAVIGQQIYSHFMNIESLTGLSDSIAKAIFNEQQRFHLWARNLGLYHRGHSSLDYRLRDSRLLFDYTLGLLNDLQDTISELKRKLRENLTPFDELEYTSDEVDYQEMSDTISESDSDGNLSSYETDGHSSNFHSVQNKFKKTFTPFYEPKNISDQAHCQENSDKSSESDSDENLSSYEAEPIPILFVSTITSIIDRLYRLAFKIRNPRIRIGLTGTSTAEGKQLNAESDLITCLRASDAARIQDLLRSYNPTHDAKKTDSLIQRLVNANAHRRRQFEYWRHRREQYEAQSNFELTGVAASISQPATATVLDPKKIDIHETTSISSTGTSLRSAFEGSDPYPTVPGPPPLEAGAKEFECPYCYTLLSSTTHRKDKWELHVYRDLRPYTCTFEDCKDPDQQYDSFHDWVAHETSTHISQSANIPSSTQSTSILVRKCPFCEDEAASAAHIASHLRRIACFTLPSSESDEFEDETSLPAPEEAVLNSGVCLLCGTKGLNRGVLKRHLANSHYPQYVYSCPKPGCATTQRRKDKIQAHIRTHPGFDWTSYERTELPCPAQCNVCLLVTTSWDAFYTCVLSHCQKEGPSEEAMVDSKGPEESLLPLNRGVFKRRLADKHPQYRYYCPKPGCATTQRRKDRIQAHIRTHPGFDSASYKCIELPCPAQCNVCSLVTTSWDAFYTCVLSHYKAGETF